MRRHARVLFAIAALASFFAFATTASAAYLYKGAFSGPGSEDGEISTPGRAAVEPSTGNLFVVDSGNDRVQVFKPSPGGTANYLTQFGAGELSEPWGIAIDEQSGHTYVYVADAGNERIVKYDSDGAETPGFTVDGSFSSPLQGAGAGEVGDFKAALAVDPTSHDLLLADEANKLIDRFEADGSFASSFDGSNGADAFSGPIDLAVNSDGDVYVVDATGDIANAEGTSKVLRYSGAGEFKAELGPVGSHERPATVAVNPYDDSVMVSGDQDAVYEAGPRPFVPVLQLFDAANEPLSSPSLEVEGTSVVYDKVAGMAIGTGTADQLYVVLDSGYYEGGPFGTPQIQAFRQIHPAAPSVGAVSAGPSYTEVNLGATVNSRGEPTSYRFEYGSTAAYGQSTATKTIPIGETGVEVTALVTGLSEGTTYHYRVVAENSLGTATSLDSTFTTLTHQGGGSCPNEAIRVQQQATYLPDCRAYEMVSPLDKGGYDVAGATYNGIFTTQKNGEGFFYTSLGVIPGITSGSALPNGYVAKRGASGWSSEGITPPATATATAPKNGLGVTGRVSWLSEDFQQAVVSTNKPLVPAASTGIDNMFLQRNPGLDYRLLTAGGPSVPTDGLLIPEFQGATPDLSHVIFGSAYSYTPDAPAQEDPFYANLYDFHDDERTLLSVRPDGTPFAGPESRGMRVAPLVPGPTYGTYQHPISEDGDTVFFGSPGAGLFVRIDGAETKRVPDASGVSSFIAANPAGSEVLFYGDNGICRYNVDTGAVTVLVPGGNAIAMVASEDLSTFYIISDRALEPGQEPLPSSNPVEEKVEAVYRWHDGEIKHLATLIGKGTQLVSFQDVNGSGALDRGYEAGSADGSAFAFSFAGQVAGQPASNGREQVYLFDASSGEGLKCVSCLAGRPIQGEAQLWQVPGGNSSPYKAPVGRRMVSLSPDGKRLFFETTAGLVPRDSNGVRDVYVYEDGRPRLLSSGTSQSVARIVGTSESGDDVFISTQASLSGRDTDRLADIYDVRVDGGFAEPTPPTSSCEGSACQGAPTPAPAALAAGSATLASPGNAARRKSCVKPRKKANRSARCAKKHKAKKHKRGKHRRKASGRHRAKQPGGNGRRGK